MRRLLLVVAMIISLSAAAQNKNIAEKYLKMHAPMLKNNAGLKVYKSPEGNMPCIVPDMKEFNMPNAGAGIKIQSFGAGAIPNPGARPDLMTIIPRGKTTLPTKPS